MATPAIEVRRVSKSFGRGTPALADVSMTIRRGQMVALIGASGSGKSTLIRTIAGLLATDRPDRPRAGEPIESAIEIFGETMQRGGRISANAGQIRSRVGVIFQQFNLVPRLTVLTNVLMGSLGRVPRWQGSIGLFPRREKARAMLALARVGIADQALKRGSALSGGQQQRAAIARALVQGADVIIADEPIASLDPSSARRVMDILADLNRNEGITVLVSLHQVEYALGYCPRTIAMRAGSIAFDGPSSQLTPSFLGELYGAESERLFLPGFEAGARTPARRQGPLVETERPAASVVPDREAIVAGA